jgi:hypothetical protein
MECHHHQKDKSNISGQEKSGTLTPPHAHAEAEGEEGGVTTVTVTSSGLESIFTLSTNKQHILYKSIT